VSAAPLRAGVAGLGVMGRHHLRALRAMEGVQLVGIADPLGAPPLLAHDDELCGSLDELVGRKLDICVVATPTELHEEFGMRLAEAGVHTLIEKPLAADVGAGRNLVAAFERAGVVGCVGHIERYNAAIRSLHERLSAGELGDVYQVATSRQGPFPDRVRDVGVVKDLATHDLDLTAWATGSPYRWVAARTATRSGRPHEDLVACVGALASGAVTNHLVNWLTPTKDRRVVVTGERGCFTADTLTGDLTFYSNGVVASEWDDISQFRGVSVGDVIRYALRKPEPLTVELESFCAASRGEGSSTVSLAEGLDTLVVAEAVLRSAELGLSVELAG